MKCEMCTDNDKKGVAGKGSRSESCRGVEHGQTCTKDRTSAVAIRATLETAVQLGRGDEASQSEQARRNGQPYEMKGCATACCSMIPVCMEFMHVLLSTKLAKGSRCDEH
jgi:hypothetical protein